MAEHLKILMVDDHSLILEGYKSKLQQSFDPEEIQLFIETAGDSDEAQAKISKLDEDSFYDVVFLDISIPPSRDRKILSGEDLGYEIRKRSPRTSLIVLTMYNENLRLLNILKNLDPEAFLVKSDITPEEFLKAFKKVLEGQVHYSQTVISLMRKQVTSEIVLNEHDRAILYFLSEGVRTKDLVEKVPLSLAAIEKRKKFMREVFRAEEGGDLALINQARRQGFL